MGFLRKVTVTAAIAAITTVGAFPTHDLSLDESRPDGIYSIHQDPVSLENVHTLIVNANELSHLFNSSTMETAQLQRRGSVNWPANTKPVCDGSNYFESKDLWNWPYNALTTWCSQHGKITLDKNRSGLHDNDWKGIYAQYNRALAYFCTYSTNPCPQEEILEAYEWLTSVCATGTNGWQEAGYLNVPNWKKAYGFTDISQIQAICTDGEGDYYNIP